MKAFHAIAEHAAAEAQYNVTAAVQEVIQHLAITIHHAAYAAKALSIVQEGAQEITQTAAVQAGTIQALPAEIAERSSNTAMDVTGQAHINASTKVLAHQGKGHAQATRQ